jgi:hypothetical protein
MIRGNYVVLPARPAVDYCRRATGNLPEDNSTGAAASHVTGAFSRNAFHILKDAPGVSTGLPSKGSSYTLPSPFV